MTQLHVDPDKLRGFANDMKKFNEVILQCFDKLNRETGRLGQSWQDAEYHKFLSSYTPTLFNLKNFVSENEKLIPQLIRDADAIEEYQKRN
jgi:uncharacterized protein YukE